MADNGISLGIQVDAAKDTIAALDAILNRVKSLGVASEKLQNNMIQKITGDNPNEIRAVVQQVQAMQKALKSLESSYISVGDTTSEQAKAVSENLKKASQQITTISKTIGSATNGANVVATSQRNNQGNAVGNANRRMPASEMREGGMVEEKAYTATLNYMEDAIDRLSTDTQKSYSILIDYIAALDTDAQKLASAIPEFAEGAEDTEQLQENVKILTSNFSELQKVAAEYTKQQGKENVEITRLMASRKAEIDKINDALQDAYMQRIAVWEEEDRQERERLAEIKSQKADALVELADQTLERFGQFGKQFGVLNNIIRFSEDRFDALGNEIEGTGVGIVDFLESLEGLPEKIKAQADTFQTFGEKTNVFAKSMQNYGTSLKTGEKQVSIMGKNIGGLAKASKVAGSGVNVLGKAVAGFGNAAQKYAGTAGSLFSGVMLGFGMFDEMTGKSAEAIGNTRDAIKEEITARKNLREMIRSGNREGIESQADALREEIAYQREYKKSIKENAQAMTGIFDQIRTGLGSVLGDKKAYGEAADEMKLANKEIARLEKELAGLTSETTRANLAIAEYNKQLADQADDAVSEVKKSEQELFDMRFNLLNKQDELQKDLIDAELANMAEINTVMLDREKEDTKALSSHLSELSGMETTYQREQQLSLREHYNELATSEKEYLNDLAEIEDNYKKADKDAETEYRKSRADEIKGYEEGLVEKREQYQKTLIQMEDDFQKERIQRQKDLAEQLFEAEMDNDALQYYMLKRNSQKEEKEALESHQEALTEEQKNFEEESKEEARQHAENLEQLWLQAKEERAQRHQEHIENVATRKQQFDDEIKSQKEAFNQKMADAKFQYQQERAEAVKSFLADKNDREVARAQEDEDREIRLASRRKELDDAFQLELEYYQLREDALTAFLATAQPQIGARDKAVKSARFGGAGETLQQSENIAIFEVLNSELARFTERFGSDTTAMTDEIRTQYLALTQATSQAEAASWQQSGSPFDLSQTISDTSLQGYGVNVSQFLADTISAGFNRGIAQAYQDNELSLQYSNAGELENARQARSTGNLQQTEYLGRQVIEDQRELYEELDLQQTAYGLQTTTAMERQATARTRLERDNDKRSLSQLQTLAETQNEIALQQYDDEYNLREQNAEDSLTIQQRHFQRRESNEEQLGEDLLLARELANERNIDTQTYYDEASLALEETHQNTLISQREKASGEQLAVEAEAQASAFETRLSTESENQSVLNETIIESAEELQKRIEKTSKTGGQSVVAIYTQMMQNIVAVSLSGLTQLNKFLVSMNNANKNKQGGNTGSSNSGNSYTGNSGGTKTPPGGNRGRGTLAAEGGIFDKPTLVVLGEGDTSEAVIPLDQSKGIPDDVWSKMASKKAETDFTRVGDASLLYQISKALSNLETGMSLNINSIQVGSELSRDEVRGQFVALQKTLVDVMNERINNT